VSLTGRNVDNLEAVSTECKKLGAKVVSTAGDITSDAIRKKLVQNTLSKFGRIDVLVNNAGMSLPRRTILDPNYEYFDQIHDVNLRSVYHMCGLTAQELVKTKGNIINISSCAGIKALPGTTSYCVAKAGFDMLTRCLAAELAPHGVRVNGINPAVFKSDFLRYMTTDKEEMNKMYDSYAATMHALGRVGEPVELARLVLFLASDEASFMTGINAPCDGGFLVK